MDSRTWCRTPALSSAASRFFVTVPKKSTISALSCDGLLVTSMTRVGAAQRVRQAAARVRVDPGGAADRHGLVTCSLKSGNGEPPDPAGGARDRDSHESSLDLIEAIEDA